MPDPFDQHAYLLTVNRLVADVHKHQSWIRRLREHRYHSHADEAWQKLQQLADPFVQKVTDFIERHRRFAIEQLSALGDLNAPNPFDDVRKAVLESAIGAVSLDRARDEGLALHVGPQILQRFREAKAAYDLEVEKLRKPPNKRPAVEEDSYVPAVKLWREKFSDYAKAKRFLAAHPEIRTRKPSVQRLEIHAADWAKFWAEQDRNSFDNLAGDSERPSIADDPDMEKNFLAGADERLAAVRAKKRAGKK